MGDAESRRSPPSQFLDHIGAPKGVTHILLVEGQGCFDDGQNRDVAVIERTRPDNIGNLYVVQLLPRQLSGAAGLHLR